MTVTHMEIRDSFGENLPGLALDRTRDALAKYCELRWRFSRRKAVAREWDLTDDEARSVCTGRCSWATFDRIITHDRGGWSVLFLIYAALLNETAGEAIQKERSRHAQHAARLGALVGDFGAARAARHPVPADDDPEPDSGDEPVRRRVGEGDAR